MVWYDQQFRNCLLCGPHHWLCPWASSPHGHKKAVRVPMSPVDMTISRGRKGPFPLVSFSWEPGTPSLQPPKRPPLLLHWPEPGHVLLLSQLPSGKPPGHGGYWEATSQSERESQPDHERMWGTVMDGAGKWGETLACLDQAR